LLKRVHSLAENLLWVCIEVAGQDHDTCPIFKSTIAVQSLNRNSHLTVWIHVKALQACAAVAAYRNLKLLNTMFYDDR